MLACNPRHLAYKQLLYFYCHVTFSLTSFRANAIVLYLVLILLIWYFLLNNTIKTFWYFSHWLSIHSTPWWLAEFNIVHWLLVTSQLLAVCYLTSFQTALLRAQLMRSETLLVIGWMRCSLEAEVLGFSLWGRVVRVEWANWHSAYWVEAENIKMRH